MYGGNNCLEERPTCSESIVKKTLLDFRATVRRRVQDALVQSIPSIPFEQRVCVRDRSRRRTPDPYVLFYIRYRRGFLRKNRGWEIGSRLRLHFRPLRDEGGGCVITEPRLKKSGGSLINGAFAASIALRIVTASTSRRVIAFSVHRRRIVISASIGLGNGQTRVGVENTSALIIKANGTATMAELLVKKKRSKKKGAKTGL